MTELTNQAGATIEGSDWRYPQEVQKLAESLPPGCVVTKDGSSAIVHVASGDDTLYVMDEHYLVRVWFQKDGTVQIEDGPDRDQYQYKAGEGKTEVDISVSDMIATAEWLKKASKAVPEGNKERFGGLLEMAKAKRSVLAVDRYVEAYDKLSPEERKAI